MRTAPEEIGVRTVRGLVGYQGVISGSGTADWTVTKTGTGTYTVRFLRPFKNPPTVMITSAGATVVNPAGVNADSFGVQTWNQAYAATDQSFHFVATGR